MLKNIWEHPVTTISGLVIAALHVFLSNCPNSKYAAGATVVLGFVAQDPRFWK